MNVSYLFWVAQIKNEHTHTYIHRHTVLTTSKMINYSSAFAFTDNFGLIKSCLNFFSFQGTEILFSNYKRSHLPYFNNLAEPQAIC